MGCRGGIGIEYFLGGSARPDQADDGADRDPHASYARFSTHDPGINRYAFQSSHGCLLAKSTLIFRRSESLLAKQVLEHGHKRGQIVWEGLPENFFIDSEIPFSMRHERLLS